MARTYYHHAATHTRKGTIRPNDNLLNEPILWRCLLLAALTYLVWSEKIAIVFDFTPRSAVDLGDSPKHRSTQAAMMSDVGPPPAKISKKQVTLPPGTEGYARFVIDPEFADRNRINVRLATRAEAICQEYIERFAPVAVAEMNKFGIPASIILAQGLLESNAGNSHLAQKSNNHFGIKCFSNKCRKGHCVNFTDDSHKDFFVQYGNVWSSYRAHSTQLKNSRRYSHLFRLAPTDYQNWAYGLKDAGYATDKRYAEKLIAIIQNLDLHKFDR